ncbi:dynamin-binding protein-like [Ornithodoros turicata]|uniref:dynamin-binding protein-like n=1 Tax=Ornithodoros turicata TaxID=34597 RepID=UPI0031396578
MEPGTIVRSLSDFDSGLDGELSLKNGDVIQVVEAVDKHWTLGDLRGQRGKFPSSVVVEVKPPLLNPGQELFVGVADFISDVQGDLCFSSGDLIVGLSPVDDNWWEGRCEGRSGIFPMSHVWKADSTKLRSAADSAFVDLWARVRQDMAAQLDDELSLVQGEMVHITKIIDHDWYWGECKGQEGRFPRRFVTVLPKDEAEISAVTAPPAATDTAPELSRYDAGPPKPPRTFKAEATNSEDNEDSTGSGYHSLNSGIAPYARAKYPFSAQYPNELSFSEGELITMIRHIDDEWTEGELNGEVGLFPTDFVDIIVDCSEAAAPTQDSTPVVSEFRDEEPARFGRALFDFTGDVAGDLPLRAGDVIVLLGRLNSDWYRARTRDGRVGICPTNFVEEMSRSPDAGAESKKMGRYNSAPSCQILSKVSDDRKRKTLTRPSAVNEVESGAAMNSLPTGTSSLVEESAAHLRRANTLTSSESAAFKREVASFHEPKTPQKKGPVPTRPPPPIPRSATSSCLPSRAAPPVPYQEQQPREATERVCDVADVAAGTGFASGAVLADEPNADSSQVKADVDRERAEERKRKVREHRQCVITELLQTERDYIKDLQICYDIYLRDQSASKDLEIDMATLFGNLDEVIAVANQLLSLIEDEARKTEQDQMIGSCFVNMADELKEVYGHYCRNHDDVSGLWTKYMENPQTMQFLQAGVEQMQRETNCFDLPSVLIKPVQRILKYPLLINELEKSTEEGHPDKKVLLDATARMSDVATSINEFKRRKDLVFKYRKNADVSLSRRLAKLNLHSVLKKSSRLGMRLSSTFGFGPLVKDEEFEREERDFRVLEKAIKMFLKDLGMFCDQLKEIIHVSLQLAESIADFYQEMKSMTEVEQYRTVQRTICTEYWQQFSMAVDRDVVAVLKQVLQMFAGPNKLITKREHKLLDYAACRSRVEKNKDISKQKTLSDEEQMAKNTYEALNSQLLDDLPKLCSISADILHTCVQDFLRARKMLIGRTTRELMTLMELPLMLSAKSSGDVLENFRIKHVLVLKTLAQEPLMSDHNFFASLLSKADAATLPKSARSKANSNKRSSLGALPATPGIQGPQTEAQKVYIKSTYSPDSLYVALEDYMAVDVLDMSLKKGDIIGVVKRQDPMGSSLRWFVDNGTSKGFVPAKYLSSLPPPHRSSLAPSAPTVASRSPSPNSQQGRVTPQPRASEPPPPYSEKDPLQMPLSMSNRPAAPPTAASATTRLSLPAVPTQSANQDVARNPGRKSDVTIYNYSFSPGAALDSSDAGVASGEPSIGSPIKEATPATRYDNCEFDPLAPAAIANPMEQHPTHNGHTVLGGGERYANIEVESNQLFQQPPAVNEYHYALYPFSASGPHQLSVAQGQVVLVLHKYDLHGNPDWWFVQDRHNNKGYVPGNYLQKYQ